MARNFINRINLQRNLPCVCGSGKKFKKCCLDKKKKEESVRLRREQNERFKNALSVLCPDNTNKS